MTTRMSKTLVCATLMCAAMGSTYASEEYSDQFNYGQANGKGHDWIQAITVTQPVYRSTIQGTTKISFTAPGMNAAEARCWHPPDDTNPSVWGYDAVVMPSRTITGTEPISFDFPADEFPRGPITIRIATRNNEGKQDLCELQLFNENGVVWNQGIPQQIPPGAEDLKLIFADDFDTTPSISSMGVGTTYMGHKPWDGSQDFSGWRFSHKDDYEGAHDPYEQSGTWLRIKARAEGPDKRNWGTGIFAPVNIDGGGVVAAPPFYMECRFIAQSAPGAWPAFWTLTVPNPDIEGTDELDIIEGYGGVGPGNPNDDVGYHVVSHFWGQKEYSEKKGFDGHRRVPMMELGGKSYWSTTFHTYGVRVDAKDTVYYFDNIEVLRHPSGPISATTPAFFMVNYAIGGISGWKIDMKRYGNASDMWVDYVRVYSTTLPQPSISPTSSYLFDKPTIVTFDSPAPSAAIHYTLDGSEPTVASPMAKGPITIDKPCTITAIAAAEGMTSSKPITAKVHAALTPKAEIEGGTLGLSCDYYEGEWKEIPDFTTLTPKSSEIMETISFPAKRADDHFALRFTGVIDIPTSGLYTFFTKTDDGSQLLIDGQVIVDNGGLHGAVERKGTVGVLAGKHMIEVRYFEAWGGESLQVTWQSPDMAAPAAIPTSALTTGSESTPANAR
jgi:hypothetical protein